MDNYPENESRTSPTRRVSKRMKLAALRRTSPTTASTVSTQPTDNLTPTISNPATGPSVQVKWAQVWCSAIRRWPRYAAHRSRILRTSTEFRTTTHHHHHPSSQIESVDDRRWPLLAWIFVSLETKLTRAPQPSHHFSLFGPRSTVTVLGRSQ
jgi:hypothetical protein